MIYLIDDRTCVEGDTESFDALKDDFRRILNLPPQPKQGFSAADNFQKLRKWKAECGLRIREVYFQFTAQRRSDVVFADAFVAYLVKVHKFVEKRYEPHHVF